MDDKTIMLVLVGIVACGEADAGDDGSDTGLPDPCDMDESPFLQPDCLAALRLACNQHLSEGPCFAAESSTFDGYSISCAWVDVATFSDATTCELESTVGRCDGARPPGSRRSPRR